MDKSYEDIAGALTDYFDGFYACDVDTLKNVFHPACHLYSATNGDLVDNDMENVYRRLAERESPASRGDARIDRILSIDKSDDGTALVKLQIAIGDKLFHEGLENLDGIQIAGLQGGAVFRHCMAFNAADPGRVQAGAA